jgi:small subunit ribosomal protein S2
MLTKKEVGKLERERKHLEQNLAGIKAMPGLPDAIFVIDSNNEGIAVREARKLAIPVVAVVDTNCDPEQVNYPIPGNDDALRAIRLFTSKIAEAVIEGNALAAAAAAGPQGADGEAVEAGPDGAGSYTGGGAPSDYDPNGGPAAVDAEGAPGVTRFHA